MAKDVINRKLESLRRCITRITSKMPITRDELANTPYPGDALGKNPSCQAMGQGNPKMFENCMALIRTVSVPTVGIGLPDPQATSPASPILCGDRRRHGIPRSAGAPEWG
jgi:hypothetical protein